MTFAFIDSSPADMPQTYESIQLPNAPVTYRSANNANDLPADNFHSFAGAYVNRIARVARTKMMIAAPSAREMVGQFDAGSAVDGSATSPLLFAARIPSATMTDVLKTIVRRKRKEVAAAKIAVPLEELRERISELGRTRNFFQAVFDHGNTSRTRLIAEVKHKSPSAGVIREDFDPVAIARQYHAGGATAISCLTDTADFGGKLEYIHAIRDAIPLPVMRKDFIIDTYQIWESRAAGADAVLLIAECLRESEVIDFQILCVELGMTILLEVHDAENLCRVLNHVGFPHAGYSLLGINNRNLRTMKTDINHSLRMADLVEDSRILVSESGITTPEDLKRLRSHGINIVLVGEHLMRQPNVQQATRDLLS